MPTKQSKKLSMSQVNRMQSWSVGNIQVKITLGHESSEEFDLAVASEGITLAFNPIDPRGKKTSEKISIREKTSAKQIIHWPEISVLDKNRREVIYNTVKKALTSAEQENARLVGLYIFCLEIARIPSWEVAEEIVKAINEKSNQGSNIDSVVIITSSAVQLSSLQFALDNQQLVTYRND